MVAFIFSMLVGAIQIVLLSVMLKGALKGDMKKAIVPLLLKFFVYAIGFTALYFFFMDSIYFVASGLVTGVVIGLISTLIYTKKKEKQKGDDTGEHGRAD